jgi:hypothetical protein
MRELMIPHTPKVGWIIAWILGIRIGRIIDEIEKGSQRGESQFLCALFDSI